MAEYARPTVFAAADGGALIYLRELTSVEMTTESGQQAVDLLNEGLGGFTPGSGRVRLRVGYAVPISGAEFPYQEATAQGNLITMQYNRADKSYVGEGKIMSTTETINTGASLEGSFEWEGPLSAME
jgi:hypothetical protein